MGIPVISATYQLGSVDGEDAVSGESRGDGVQVHVRRQHEAPREHLGGHGVPFLLLDLALHHDRVIYGFHVDVLRLEVLHVDYHLRNGDKISVHANCLVISNFRVTMCVCAWH